MTVSVAVIDYGAGNLRSIRRALEAAGAAVSVTSNPIDVRLADGVVFPGVGAAGAAMDRLHGLGLVDAIESVVQDNRPFMGICLGMQLLFGQQEEGDTHGLGLLEGRVHALGSGVKIPQIGWNQVRWVQDGSGYETGDAADFYFVHSYIVEPADPADVVAVARYGEVFPGIVRHGEIWGMQFHPEKSGPAGLRLVSGWVESVRAAQMATRDRVPA